VWSSLLDGVYTVQVVVGFPYHPRVRREIMTLSCPHDIVMHVLAQYVQVGGSTRPVPRPTPVNIQRWRQRAAQALLREVPAAECCQPGSNCS
jgi:hypothetical protein